MNAEQKFKLTKTIIIAMAIVITTVAIVWFAIIHNPSSMKAIIDFSRQRVVVDCTFYNQEETSEIDTPCE